MTRFEEIRLAELDNVLNISRGFPTQHTAPQGDVRVMSVAGLRNDSPARHFADRDVMQDLGLDVAQPGDVLIAVEGGTAGESLVVPDGIDEFIPSQQAATLRVTDTGQLDPWYLGAFLGTEPTREQIRRLARGSAIQRIPIKDFDSVVLKVPPIAHQREIGRRFCAFEQAIKSHRAVTSCLEELRDADLLFAFAGEEWRPASAT